MCVTLSVSMWLVLDFTMNPYIFMCCISTILRIPNFHLNYYSATKESPQWAHQNLFKISIWQCLHPQVQHQWGLHYTKLSLFYTIERIHASLRICIREETIKFGYFFVQLLLGLTIYFLHFDSISLCSLTSIVCISYGSAVWQRERITFGKMVQWQPHFDLHTLITCCEFCTVQRM